MINQCPKVKISNCHPRLAKLGSQPEPWRVPAKVGKVVHVKSYYDLPNHIAELNIPVLSMSSLIYYIVVLAIHVTV